MYDISEHSNYWANWFESEDRVQLKKLPVFQIWNGIVFEKESTKAPALHSAAKRKFDVSIKELMQGQLQSNIPIIPHKNVGPYNFNRGRKSLKCGIDTKLKAELSLSVSELGILGDTALLSPRLEKIPSIIFSNSKFNLSSLSIYRLPIISL